MNCFTWQTAELLCVLKLMINTYMITQYLTAPGVEWSWVFTRVVCLQIHHLLKKQLHWVQRLWPTFQSSHLQCECVCDVVHVSLLLPVLQLSGQFSQRMFRKLPPRVCVPLKNIVSEEFLRAGSVCVCVFISCKAHRCILNSIGSLLCDNTFLLASVQGVDKYKNMQYYICNIAQGEEHNTFCTHSCLLHVFQTYLSWLHQMWPLRSVVHQRLWRRWRLLVLYLPSLLVGVQFAQSTQTGKGILKCADSHADIQPMQMQYLNLLWELAECMLLLSVT